MDRIYIDYGKRINQAILNVIKEILKDLSKSKISSNHCFYITFKTKNKDVDISKNLIKEYPNEMTIVLQNQYWDLKVEKNNFSVALLFNKKKENISIPFESIIKFYDPFVKFSIQLEFRDEKKQFQKNSKRKKKITKEKIITLSDFRKKND
ncbi:MAG: ClpXP protease specificity-enhancing factor SspB [Pseudomonadota bacterium]|nr:ClpXP protease specificity-enhancing factor SspB [Pseudomonadota bacterium]